MRITAKILHAKHACADQVKLFQERFPDGVDVTEANCIAVADLFDWSWASARLLSVPAYAEYDRVCAPAYAAYDRVCAPARAEYDRARLCAG